MSVCTRCSRASLVSIGVALSDGTEAVMHSCTGCENRSWRRNGVDLTMAEVLPQLASRRRRPYRTAA